jgi:indole-3-glycerol phosphate synthase
VTILERILARKREEVAALRRDPGEAALRAAAALAPPVRGFARALREGARPRVIAEFKRASPSKGAIRADADPARIARAYADAGARALSVLTDREFFSGCLEDLRRARAACSLPVLRKDFSIDALQLVEARAAGADAVLLIAAALDDADLDKLLGEARALGLDALVEVHDRAELERARALGAELVGINNRDLRTFHTDVAVTRALCAHAGDCTLVSESGLEDAATLRELDTRGVAAFLVGEALMRAPDPGQALRALRGGR